MSLIGLKIQMHIAHKQTCILTIDIDIIDDAQQLRIHVPFIYGQAKQFTGDLVALSSCSFAYKFVFAYERRDSRKTKRIVIDTKVNVNNTHRQLFHYRNEKLITCYVIIIIIIICLPSGCFHANAFFPIRDSFSFSMHASKCITHSSFDQLSIFSFAFCMHFLVSGIMINGTSA